MTETLTDSAESVETERIVRMHDKDFKIEPPDGLILLRILKVLSRIVQRADGEGKELGVQLFGKVAAKVTEPKESASESLVSEDLVAKVLLVVSASSEDDLLKLGSALLQFPDEAYGVRWLKKHGIKLAPLMRALVLTLEQLDDVVEALRVFMPTLSGLRLLGTAATVAQDGSDSL